MEEINRIIKDLESKNLSNSELLKEFKNVLITFNDKIKAKTKVQDELMTIFDNLPNTISWIDKDFNYIRVNKALANIYGINPREFIGKKIGHYTNENFFYDFASDLFKSDEVVLNRELEARINDSYKTFLVSGTKVDNNATGIIIGIDVTELKILKDQILLKERLATLGEIFSGIIHDINNPLMSIFSNLRKINHLTSNNEITDLTAKIELSSKKITKIVEGIKVYIYDDSEVEYKVEDIGSIIDDSIVILENKLLENSVFLNYEKKFIDIKVNCNFTQIYQVFVNLISNSIDALAKIDQKWIEIRLRVNQNKLVINVIDSGPGIPQAIKEKIFTPFYTTKEKGVGSGLGLALCKQIIEAHNGSIVLIDGKNTNFEISLPIAHDK